MDGFTWCTGYSLMVEHFSVVLHFYYLDMAVEYHFHNNNKKMAVNAINGEPRMAARHTVPRKKIASPIRCTVC